MSKVGWALFFIILSSCQTGKDSVSGEDRILSYDENHIAIFSDDSEIPSIIVENQPDQPVLGKWIEDEDELRFIPLVSFTPGITYQVFQGDQLLDSFIIMKSTLEAPHVVAFYPSVDTVPENLLKVYIEFSKPMMEGQALNNITVLNHDSEDTLKGTFLDLQTELWNHNNTILTLWLDPGRIKRGLVPNLEMGNPLTKGVNYRIVIGSNWRSTEGEKLSTDYKKDFFTKERDDQSPDPNLWQLEIPESGSLDPIMINFGESLDAILLRETIRIVNNNQIELEGTIDVNSGEMELSFVPEEEWEMGQYTIRIESRLEDLAGNNLNRLFDQEISSGSNANEASDLVNLSFYIN